PGADIAHRRTGRVPHAVPAVRGSARPHRPEADREREEGAGGGSRVASGGRAGGVTRLSRAATLSVMTRVTRVALDRSCAICERTLLMGEKAIRFSPTVGGDYVDVCPLCAETAVEHGWFREGAPTTPTVAPERKRRSSGWLSALLGTRPRAADETIIAEPILRRLSDHEQAMIGAADLFDASQYRRSVGGTG